MKREKVLLTGIEEDDEEILNGNKRYSEWKWISEETTSIDLDKGIEDRETILQRVSDGKFFKFEWAYTGNHSLYSDGLGLYQPLKGEEVFPRQVTTTVYE